MKLHLFIFLIFSLQQWMLAAEPVALIAKLRGAVKHKIVSDIKYRSKTQLNTPILSDSQIRTNNKAFSKVVYLDDGTAISMYPDTEIIIKGSIDNRMIIKQVDLINGIIMVNVVHQTSREFKLTTPYSELTCRECSFWVISDELDGDQFIKESGDAQILNASINSTRELIFDSTLVSQKKVEFVQFKTPIKDVKFIESLMLDADERSFQYKKENPEEKTSETITKIVVIKLKNAANVEREIIVTYTQ